MQVWLSYTSHYAEWNKNMLKVHLYSINGDNFLSKELQRCMPQRRGPALWYSVHLHRSYWLAYEHQTEKKKVELAKVDCKNENRKYWDDQNDILEITK